MNACSLRSLLFDSGRGGVEIDFNLAKSEGVNFYSRRDGDADFKFFARDTPPTYVDNRLPSIGLAEEGPLLVAGKPERREYRAVFVVGDCRSQPIQERNHRQLRAAGIGRLR